MYLWKLWLLTQLSQTRKLYFVSYHNKIYATVSISIGLSSGSQALWMSCFSHTALRLMSPAFPGRALVMWGVSFRPVQMAKQESEERGAADKLHTHTHPGHCWRPHRNNSSLGAAEKACSRESSKANEGMLSTYQRLVERLIGRIVSLSCQRWGPFMLQMICFLYLFDSIHIVISTW